LGCFFFLSFQDFFFLVRLSVQHPAQFCRSGACGLVPFACVPPFFGPPAPRTSRWFPRTFATMDAGRKPLKFSHTLVWLRPLLPQTCFSIFLAAASEASFLTVLEPPLWLVSSPWIGHPAELGFFSFRRLSSNPPNFFLRRSPKYRLCRSTCQRILVMSHPLTSAPLCPSPHSPVFRAFAETRDPAVVPPPVFQFSCNCFNPFGSLSPPPGPSRGRTFFGNGLRAGPLDFSHPPVTVQGLRWLAPPPLQPSNFRGGVNVFLPPPFFFSTCLFFYSWSFRGRAPKKRLLHDYPILGPRRPTLGGLVSLLPSN